MKVLVCGGRDYAHVGFFGWFMAELDKEVGITHIIAGGARGADTLAVEWAQHRGLPFTVYWADWALYGRAAGSKRNTRMLVEGKPDLVVAFPGGRGTANMIQQTTTAGVPLRLAVTREREYDEIILDWLTR